MDRGDLGALSFVMGVPGGHVPLVEVTRGTTFLVMGAMSLVMGVAGRRSLERKPCPQGRVPVMGSCQESVGGGSRAGRCRG